MKKLIPALCMLLIAAALLGTSTYAWFSMNTTVTADGMSISAKSESLFLQIVNADESFSNSEPQKLASAANASRVLRPTSAASAIATDSITPLSNGSEYGAILFAEAFSNDPKNSAAATDYDNITEAANSTEVTTNFYTLVNEFKVRLNPTAGLKKAKDLTVSQVTIETTNEQTANNVMRDAVRVLIVYEKTDEDDAKSYAWALWSYSTAQSKYVSISSSSNVLADEVTDTPLNVKVYVYFDGEDATTTTNNATTLSTDGYKVEIKFTVSAAAPETTETAGV